jgi:hypothetical protein
LDLWLTEAELQEFRAREITLFEDRSTCVERVEIDVREIHRLEAAVLEEDSQLLSIGRFKAETLVTGAAVDDPSGGEALTVDRRCQSAAIHWTTDSNGHGDSLTASLPRQVSGSG